MAIQNVTAYKTVCYFSGASVQALRDALAAYPSPDTLVKIQQHGNSYLIAVCNPDGDGDPINDSHPCPGSPGC